MEVEEFYIEKHDNFVQFLSMLKAKYTPDAVGISPLNHFSTLSSTLEGYKVLLKAAVESGSVDGYVKTFLWEDSIGIGKVSSNRVSKLKRYLELFSSL
jgi:hypothetical protein